jgi:hypothetical protein
VVGGAVVVVGVQGTVVDEVDEVDEVGVLEVVVVVGHGMVVGVTGGKVTLNFFTLNATSSPTSTEIFPVAAPAGTTAVICVGLSTVNSASTPLNFTVSTSSRLVPVITTGVPTGPFGGSNLVMVGALDGRVVVVVGGAVVGGTVGGVVGGLVGGTVGGVVGGSVGVMMITVGGGVVGATVTGAGGAVVGTVVASGRVVVLGGTVVVGVLGRVAAVEIESLESPPVARSVIPMPRTSAAATAPTVIQICFGVIVAPALASRRRPVWPTRSPWRDQGPALRTA